MEDRDKGSKKMGKRENKETRKEGKYIPAIVSAITKASCPPSNEGNGREFNTARFILSDAIKPVNRKIK